MVLLVLALIINCLVGVSVSQGQNFENNEQLRVGFYANTCPAAENIVRSVVREAAVSDEKTAPVLLRLHFHDCFVEVRQRPITLKFEQLIILFFN